jgi:hypothetical protein
MRLHSDEAAPSRAFTSPEIRLLTPIEASVLQGELPDNVVQLRRDFDGPVLVTIGPAASDEHLQRAADRLRVPVAELQRFRAMQR